jgi:hypothetical protein
VEAAPWIAAIGAYIDEHVEAFGEHPDVFPADEVTALAGDSRAAYERIHPLLVERGRAGLIRRIHGDLHLGNIVLIGERPVLFDAIEFSDLIASGDVLYDFAFLLMDLVERGLRASANITFNRYLMQTRRAEDLDALAALPFYLSMRAAIRAKVTAARFEQAKPDERPALARNARSYFDWARRFIAPPHCRLVAIGGLSGTGKSMLARALAPEVGPAPGAVVLRSDVERKAMFGRAEDAPLPADAYAPQATARVYAAICEQARRAVAAGHSAIIDAVFARARERALAENAAAENTVPFQGLFLIADLATRIARVSGRTGDASDADAAVARAQEDYDLENLDWTRVDASSTPEVTLARARRAMGG